jgi:CRP-like cAMP-binding protein
MVSMFRPEISHLPIFQGLTSEQLAMIDPLLDLCFLSRDRVIFEQGQTARYLYILKDGGVTVSYKPYDGPPLTVARIQPGGVFGWSAALGRDIYTSGAVSEVDSHAYRILGVRLHRFCENHPETGVVLLERLASVIAERLRSTHTEVMTILSQGMSMENEPQRSKSA